MKQFLRNLALVALLCVPWVTQGQTPTLNEGFESSTFPPNDWTTIHVSGAKNWDRATDQVHNSSTASAKMAYATSGHENYLVTPMLVPGVDESLSFFVSTQSYSGTTLTIEVSTTTAEASAFNTTLATYTTGSSSANYIGVNSSGTWVEKTISLADYVGQQIYIAFHVVDNNGSHLWVDDVSGVSLFVPACAKPMSVFANNINVTSATINWTIPTGQTASYMIYNGDQWVLTTEEGATYATVPGLTASTTYDAFKVRANCGGDDGTSDFATVPSFTTPCEAFTMDGEHSFTQNFDGLTIAGEIPACWNNSEGSTTTESYKWRYNTTTSGNGAASGTGHSGNCIVFNSYNNSTGLTNFLATQPIRIGVNARLIFWYKNPAGGDLSVLISTDGGTTKTTLASGLTGASSWTSDTIDLDPTTYTGQTVIIYFKGTSNCGYGNAYIYLDDVTVEPQPTCFKPTAVVVTNVATDGATISWTRDDRNAAGETYSILDNENNVVTGAESIDGTSFNITGLSANTEYTYKVHTNCASVTENVDVVTVTFTTLANCATPVLTSEGVTNITAHTADVAWTGYSSNNSFVVSVGELEPVVVASYDFEGNVIPGDFTSTTSYSWLATGDDKHNGSYAAKSGNGGMNSTTSDMVLEVTLTSEATLTFWAKVSSEASWDKAYFSIDNAVQSDLNGISGAGSWLSYSYLLGVGTHTLRWYYTKDSSGNSDDDCFYVDDIVITGEAVSTWTNHNANEASIQLTGLESESRYAVKVKGLCDDDVESDESAVVIFTTLAGCMVPTAVTVAEENITTTTAVVSWTNGYFSDEDWEINYRVSGATDWTVVNVTANPYTLTGLTANTPYELRMRTNCGLEGYSDWSATVNFRTACGQEAIPFSENFDSYASSVYKVNCWTYVPEPTSSSSYAFARYNYSYYAHSGSYMLRSYTSSSSKNNKVILPEIDAATNTLQVRFWHRASGATAGTLSVGYVTDIDDTSTFVSVTDFAAANCTTYDEYEVEMTSVPSDARIAFRHVSTITYVNWYIDDVNVEPIPACRAPRNIAFSNVERRSFTVNWQAHPLATANNYQLVISTSALDDAALEAAEKTAVNGATAFAATELERETEYHVYVRTNCGGDVYSDWISGTVTTNGLTFCEDIVVANGTTSNSYVPLYGNYADEAQTVQSIYPASMLTELVGKEISAIKYYVSSGSSASWGGGTWQVSLGITEQANLASGLDNSTALTTVYTGNLSASVSDGMTITFDAPVTYNGGNLLVQFKLPEGIDYTDCSFYGVSSTSASYVAEVSYGSGVQGFLPKFSATYCESNDACPAVTSVEASDITETSATLTWEAVTTADYLSGYQVIKSETELDADALDAYVGPFIYEGTATTCNLTGLTAYTEYYIYVRANCQASGHNDGNSTWLGYDFRTLSACGVVTNISVEQTSRTTAVATWEKTKPTQANNFNYILSTTAGLDDATLNGMPKTGSGVTELTANLTVAPATTYTLYVQNDCSGEGTSPWVSNTFTTYDAMPAVLNITATQITHTAIAATWEKNVAQFADETQWQVGAVVDDNPPTVWTVVNDTHYTFVGLTPETHYYLYVRPYQESPEAFGAAARHEATTTALPAACMDPIGEGTSTSYGPICGYYGYERNAYLFTSEDGLTAGNINKIAWNFASAATIPAKIYLKNTDATALSTEDFVWNNEIADASLVYDATAVTASGWKEFDITPFNYTGAGLIVYVASNYGGSGGGSVKASYTTSGANNHIYIRNDYSIDDDADYSTFSTKGIDNQRHNVKFCFAVDPDACRDITNITVSDITTNSANVSWMPGNAEVEWIYNIRNAELGEPTGVDYFFAETPYVSYDALLSDHDYRFWVRPWVNGEPCGNWSSVAFQTVASCGMPTVLDADGITATTATLHALAHPTIGTASTYTFRYWKAGDEENKTLVNPSTENSAALTGLTPNTTYWYDVMVSCTGDAGGSRWSEPKSFITDYQNFTLPYSTDFAAGRDNEWRMVNGTHDNKWCIGEAAGNPARGMYISNDGGTTNTYNNSGYCVVYAYAGFSNFEAAKQYTVEFDWKNKGENGNYDFIRAWIVPDNAVFEANTSDTYPAGMSSATEDPTDWISLDNNTPLKNVTEWQHKKAYVTVPTNGAYKIVFMWHQDNSVGTNPPAAIDNVSIVESEKYDITVNVTKTIENVAMGADPTAEVDDEPLASLTDIYENTTVTLTAGDPIYGYEFVNWTDNNGNPKGSGKFVYLTLKSDTVLNANYDSASFTITATANPTFGTAYGTRTVKFNQPVTLTARANTGYHFVNWTSIVDGAPVEAVEPTVEDTIIVNAYRDSIFTANFDTNEYHVTVFVEGQEMGTVDGPEFVKHFLSADYVPTPNYGYHFVNWTDIFGEVMDVKEGTENTLTIAPVSDTMVYANFDYNQYTVTGETDNLAMGSVEGTNTVNYLTPVTLIAIPEEGYHFVNWTKNNVVVSTNDTMEVVADSDYVFIAHFDTNVYNVTVNVNNTAMGSVSGPTTVKHFKNADYVATENTGYHFVNWTNLAGTELAAETVLNIAPVSDTTVNANFAVNTYALTVNVAAECTGMGTVAGSNPAAEHFQNYQISASPATGYHFAGWADLAPTDPNYTANPRTVTLTAAATYTATFDTNVYVLTVVSGNETMGSASGSVAAAKHFVSYEISAEANYGYHFTGWNDNNTDNPRTVTLTESKTYTANFTYNSYTVSGTPNNSEWGSVSGSATVNYQSDVTLTATPNYGYVFVNWKEADTVYSTQNPVAVEALSNRSLTAVFAKDQFTVNASVAAGCETMGTVAPATTTAEYMTPVTLTATPAEGYHLVSWSNGATTEQITVLADSNRNLTATFAINLYDITVNYDATRGTVIDAQSSTVTSGTVFTGVAHGTVLNFTANVNEGSRFAGWNDGAATVTTESIAYTATGTRTLTANFIDAGNFQVTLNHNNVMGTVTGAGAHHADSDVTITAEANYGYHFVAWMHDETIVSNNASYTFTMPMHDTSFTAVFDVNQYTLTVASVDTNRGTVSGTATVNYLANVPVSATNKYGYHFTHWYGNGINDTVATTANATIQVLRDSAVTANFDYNQYTVTAVSAAVNTGSVSGTATVNYLSNVTLTATPAAGYHFVNWTNAAGAEVSTNAVYEVQATENVTYTANFATTPAQLAWSAEAFTGYTLIDFNNWAPTLQNPNNVEVRYGVVEDDILVNAETGVIGAPTTYGNVVTTTGTYHIYAVHETSQQYYYDSVVYTLTVENGTLIALMKNIDDGGTVSFPDYTQEAALTYRYVDENMMAFIAHGTTVRAEATPATGFNFVEWRSGNNVAGYDSLSTNNPVTYTVPDEQASGLKAIFDTNVYNVTVVANPVEGSVEGPATVKHFLSGTYTATATPCYHFVNWTNADNTVVLGTEPTLTIAAVSDSTIKANFALNVYTGDTTVNVCDEFTWHDSTYTVTPAVAPTYVYKTANNCDSTVTLHLTIRHSNTGDTTAVACNSFTWYGTTYNTTPAVAPTHVFTNVAGCDSTVTLHLTVNYSNTGDTTAVACNSFTWYGTTYNTTPAVAPTHVFTNVAGCDSTVTLHLTVNHSNTGDTTAVACNSFTWYGTTYTSTPAVAPTHVFTNVAGCDSTVTLHLTVNHSNTGDTTAVACDSLTWYGVTYTSTPAVAPTHVLTNVAGCDSTVTLHLTINNSQTVTIDPITNCDSVLWNNTWYYQSGEQSFTTTGANGCDSTTIVMLTINNSQTVVLDPVVAYDSYEWNGVVYTESGELSFTTEGANGCDSTTIVMLTINHYDSITVILTVNDATMGTTDPEVGTYRFYPGETVSATATANEGYRFLGWVVSYGTYSDTISRDAEVSYEFVAAMAGQTFTVEAVFAENVGIKTVDYSNINIFSADSKVYVKGAEGMTIYIYDVNGRCMARRANAAETETFTLDVTGVVLVKAGNAPAKRVLLVR